MPLANARQEWIEGRLDLGIERFVPREQVGHDDSRIRARDRHFYDERFETIGGVGWIVIPAVIVGAQKQQNKIGGRKRVENIQDDRIDVSDAPAAVTFVVWIGKRGHASAGLCPNEVNAITGVG